MKELAEFQKAIARLDAMLKPIADRKVSLNELASIANGALALASPLERAGIRADAEVLVNDITNTYAHSDAPARQTIRELFVQYQAFAWAAPSPWPLTVPDGLRRHLLMFSIVDQGQDSRDAILTLKHIVATAKAGHVDVTPVLKDVATLSSDVNKFGMGSTSGMLLDAC